MKQRRRFLKVAIGFLASLGLFISPFFSLIRTAFAKAGRTILPKDTSRESLIGEDPKHLDTTNLQHPYPILEMVSKLAELKAGDILEVIGEGKIFEEEIRLFCKRINKPLLSIENNKNGKFRCKIQQV